MVIEKNKFYYGRHIPSGEDWVIIGISEKKNEVCVAGYPPTIAKLSDIENLEVVDYMNEEYLNYRKKNFGTKWDN